MHEAFVYLQLVPESALPDFSPPSAFRAVVICENQVSAEWQARVSEWLVRSGCLYMMAWGKNCSSWDDSVDFANLDLFDFKEIPDDKFVMTTWHEEETLADVFWFCKNAAFHPTIERESTVLLHVSFEGNERALIDLYSANEPSMGSDK